MHNARIAPRSSLQQSCILTSKVMLFITGTPGVRLYGLDIRPVQEPTALLVVNHKGAISHASASMGAMLGYGSKALAKMQLEDIIPVPYAQLHKGWIKVCTLQCSMHTTCRAITLLCLACLPHQQAMHTSSFMH